jgi:glycosyltransferase 2 family protein
MDAMSPPPPQSKRVSHIFTAITLVLSVACLAWALHGVSWTELWEEIRELDWRWVAVGVIADLLVYVVQGWRWSLLLLPVAPVNSWASVGAIYVGLFANEVLPLRAGELIRCFLMARWSKIPSSVTLASALIERIFDGGFLITGLFLSLRYMRHFPLSRGQARAVEIITTGSIFLAILLLICAALLAVAMYWREQTLDALLDARMFSWAHVFIEDLHRIGHSRFLYFSAAVSVPYLLLQIVPIYAIMQAYGFDGVSWAQAGALMILLRLGSVVPQAPGNVGLFQVLSTLGLTLFGVPGAMARRFTLILWGVVTLPLLIVGFFALVASGSKMGDIQREAKAEMRARQDELARS